ncbi:sulfatase-like hydrolase/transferase, partial [Acinetobacter baumannii]
VRAFLEAVGQWEDTIFVLTSDNGEQLGDHHLWGKLRFYDQSYHVPLIIRAPGMDAESIGHVVTDFTESIDVMPTILDLAGAHVPGH